MAHKTIQAVISTGEDGWYVAEAVHLNIATQGKTVDETLKNFREALELYLEGEDLSELGVGPEAPIIFTMEMAPVHA